MNVDEAIHASLREPRRNQMGYWAQALEEHRRHTQFRTEGWAYEREVGFSCGCEGHGDREWRISLTTLRDMIPEIRDRYLRIRNNSMRMGTKKQHREMRRANVKARALLHSQLTREQRWELRATKSFTILGRDGRTYSITEGSTSNVRLIENGTATKSFCVVAKDLSLPIYDLMLAQKLLLETAPEDFHKLAVVHDLTTARAARVRQDHYDIDDDDLDDPTAWVHERIAI